MKKLISEVAISSGVSERKLRALLTQLGLCQILSEARRLQAAEAFNERRFLFDQEPIHPKYFRQAFTLLSEV